jgi:dUTP pyrophosphatase
MAKNNLEDYLKRLQELDSELTEDSDPDELMIEINRVINDLSKDIQLDLKNKTSSATLKFINKSNNPDPVFDKEGASGFDIRANLNHDVTIDEGKVDLIPTGLYFEVQKGLEVQVRTKSELTINTNMIVLNSPYMIDSGEIMIILANFDDIPHVIRHGNKIAQGVVCPVYGEGSLNLIKVEKL